MNNSFSALKRLYSISFIIRFGHFLPKKFYFRISIELIEVQWMTLSVIKSDIELIQTGTFSAEFALFQMTSLSEPLETDFRADSKFSSIGTCWLLCVGISKNRFLTDGRVGSEVPGLPGQTDWFLIEPTSKNLLEQCFGHLLCIIKIWVYRKLELYWLYVSILYVWTV